MNKKSVLLIALMLVSTAFAMKFERELVSFKSLEGAPLISLYNGKQWFAKLPEEKQKCIREQIKSQKDEGLTALLRMVALPQDVQKLIVAHLFEDSNQKVADIFCTIPLCDALNQYQLSMDLVRDPRKYFFIGPNISLHVIFEHIHDIETYYNAMKHHGVCYFSKKELESLEKVKNTFGECVDCVRQNKCLQYQFYNKPITFDKIKKQTCEKLIDQMLLLSSVVSAYIYLMFPFKWQWAHNQGNIDYNSAANDLNKAIKIFNDNVRFLNQKTGGDYEVRSYTQGCREELLIFHGLDYKLFSIVSGGMSIGIFFERNSWILQLAMKNFREKNSSQKARSTLVTLFGMCGVYKVMSYIAAQFEENSLYGVGYVASLYMLLCSCYNLYKVDSLQEDCVMFKDVPQLLQRTDIEIV